MALNNYSIGGTEVKTEAFEAFADIPHNRVLLAEKLTDLPPARPEIVQGLTSVEQVFDYYKPKVELAFETEEGAMRRETLYFRDLGDFGVKGITAQSIFLKDLANKKDQYQKIARQLRTNKQLGLAVRNPNTKEALLLALHALVKELEGSK